MKTARIILIYLSAALAAAVCGVLFGAARIPLSEFIQDGALNPSRIAPAAPSPAPPDTPSR